MISVNNISFNDVKIDGSIRVRPNYSLQFDGIDEYITTTAIANSTAGTYVCWVKPLSFVGEEASSTIMGGYSSSGGFKRSYLMFNNKRISAGLGNTDQNTILDTTVLTTGVWYHFALSWDGSNVYLYRNGSVVDTAGRSGNPAINGIYIGSFNADGIVNTSTCTNSIMDEVAVYSKRLSTNDINDLYNSGNGLCINPTSTFPTDGGSMGTNLDALWHFNDGTGLVAVDSSGNGKTGSLQNTDNSNWITGKVQC